jgi:putative ABC transport system substrate-binding protein
MKKKFKVFTLCAMLLALCGFVEAQQQAKLPRIGLLRAGSPPDPMIEAFRQGLRDLNYVEGKNIVIEYRWAEGKNERLPDLAADLVRLGVDVIVSGGNAATHAAKSATKTIPIVMQSGDPVGTGLVASLARPGGNITGLSYLVTDLSGKRLELLKEALPKVSRVGLLSHYAGSPVELRETQDAARTLGVEVKILEVRNPKDFESAFEAGKTGRIGAISVLASPIFYAHRTRIVSLAAKYRLPASYNQSEFVEVGVLCPMDHHFEICSGALPSM